MLHRRLLNIAWYVLYVLQWVGGLLLILIGAALKADLAKVSKWSALAGGTLSWLQSTGWFSLTLLTLGLGLAELLRKLLGPPWVWGVIRDLLDQFQGYVFRDKGNEPLHFHRVTLFKYCRWRVCFSRWPWSGWLMPVERSGHTTRRKISVFLAPDDADRAEGIAGQTWAQNQVVLVSDLPSLEGNAVPQEVIKEYARSTWISEEWAHCRRPQARSFCGIPVEVKGKLWGVIVIDSRGTKIAGRTSVQVYTLVGRFLGKLLEKV